MLCFTTEVFCGDLYIRLYARVRASNLKYTIKAKENSWKIIASWMIMRGARVTCKSQCFMALTRVLLLKHIQFKQTTFCMTTSRFFLNLWELKLSQVIQQYCKCTVLKIKPRARHVWFNSSFLNCHDN